MFQTFEQRADPSKGSERLARLRARLAELGCDGFILPRTDAHQSEQLAPHDERLAWLTGFTGSAGTAVILADRAVIFTDGRYTVQIAGEVDTALFEIVNIADHSPGEWLGGHAGAGIKLGYDPWLLTPEGLERLEHAGEKSRPILVPLDDNPIDQVWIDQPPPPTGAITPHPLEFAGVGAGEKLAGLRQSLAADGDRGLILNLGASIAWAFNIRGSDIAHTPVPLAFAVVTADAATIFCDPAKISPATRSWLAPHAAAEPQDRFAAALDRLGSASASVRIDPASTPCWIAGLKTPERGFATPPIRASPPGRARTRSKSPARGPPMPATRWSLPGSSAGSTPRPRRAGWTKSPPSDASRSFAPRRAR
jgi:Xaa-Pro aminopeptidase